MKNDVGFWGYFFWLRGKGPLRCYFTNSEKKNMFSSFNRRQTIFYCLNYLITTHHWNDRKYSLSITRSDDNRWSRKMIPNDLEEEQILEKEKMWTLSHRVFSNFSVRKKILSSSVSCKPIVRFPKLSAKETNQN